MTVVNNNIVGRLSGKPCDVDDPALYGISGSGYRQRGDGLGESQEEQETEGGETKRSVGHRLKRLNGTLDETEERRAGAKESGDFEGGGSKEREGALLELDRM